MDEMSENDLYIPDNCPPLDYIITGYTSKEFAYIAGVVFAMFIVAGFCFTKNIFIYGLFISVTVIAFAIIFFRRDDYMENGIDKIRILITYIKMQKKYEYEYVNIYEEDVLKKSGL